VLTAISGSPFTTGSEPRSLAIDPSGSYLFIADYNAANVSVFSINSSTGALTAVAGSPFTVGTNPEGLALGI
jgi:6-phosphogluconolactonase